MDIISIIIIIVAAIAKALDSDKKKKEQNGKPMPHKQKTDEIPSMKAPSQDSTIGMEGPGQGKNSSKPWWEDWGEDEDEEEEDWFFSPEPEPEPLKVEQQPISVEHQPVKAEPKAALPNVKTWVSVQEKDKMQSAEKENSVSTKQSTWRPGLDLTQVQQGFIWAQILQPPKAKRKHNI